MGRIDKAYDLAVANLPEGVHLVTTTKRGGASMVGLVDQKSHRTLWQSKPTSLTEALIGAAGYLIHTYSGGVSDDPERPPQG
jgi:hypothetical protein